MLILIRIRDTIMLLLRLLLFLAIFLVLLGHLVTVILDSGLLDRWIQENPQGNPMKVNVKTAPGPKTFR